MALTTAAFKVRYKQFDLQDDDQVQAALDEAMRSIDENVWGDLADDGQGHLAAALLRASPFGQQAVAAETLEEDPDWKIYDDLRRRVGTAYRVLVI